MSARAGVTLVELIVVIVLLGVIASVSALALARSRPGVVVDAAAAAASAARDSALRSGRAVTIAVHSSRGPIFATALPDGRVIADSAYRIDPLTGRSSSATH